MTCEICAFGNPKPTVTAVVVKDGEVLAMRRSQEPFAAEWDLPGGFVQGGETIEGALRREVMEELGCEIEDFAKIGEFPGTYQYRNETVNILSFAYYVRLSGEPTLKSEGTELAHLGIPYLAENVAFDSNRSIMLSVRQDFASLQELWKLIYELDPNATLTEFSYYAACRNGHIVREYDEGRLVGIGSIFPRQTMLRKQAVIEDMVVASDFRRRGLGRKILNHLLEWADTHGIEVIELTSSPAREAANLLYRSAGFRLHPTNHYLRDRNH